MKRISMAVAFTLASAAPLLAGPAQDNGLPSGTYAGTAWWGGPDGAGGTYSVQRTIKGNVITSHYQWTGTKRAAETHSVTFALKPSEPFFDVLDEKNRTVGKGFCYLNACSYSVDTGPVKVSETMRWNGGTIEVFGGKTGPSFRVVWKEALKAKDSK